MCGICGSTRDPEARDVAAMAQLMVHRGPDDAGHHVDPATGVALGARRLSIIDVEHGHQPLSNEDGSIVAVLNGEIYNHPALRRQLMERGHDLATRSDTEVLVHLYEDYGDDMVHALDGMYAFALWDANRRRLLVGRDRFGEKPLFYAEHGDLLVFASELTALVQGARLTPEIDPDQVDAFFVFGYAPGPATLIKGVRQLPPGHLLVWDDARRQSQLRRYWEPPLADGVPDREPVGELVAETRRLLESSVASRMIADVDVGILISGGVDSSVIAGLAAASSREPIRTYTVGYDVGTVGETEDARKVARALSAQHRELILTQTDVAERVPSLLRSLDQPLADQAIVPHHAICELARGEVKVVVGGEGADELFGGYPRYRWLQRAAWLSGVVPETAATHGASLISRAPLGVRWQRLGDVLAPGPMLERHVDWVTWRRRHVRSQVYGSRLAGYARSQRLIDSLAGQVTGNGASPASKLMRLDQMHWLPDDVLAKADRAGMLVSVEVRTPYLQRELAEFASSVGTRAHLGGGGKRLLRKIGADLVPSAYQRRPKRAFRVPGEHWLRGPLAPLLDQQLERGAVYDGGWFDRTAMARMVREHRAGAADHTQVIWPVLAFGLWLDRLEGRDG